MYNIFCKNLFGYERYVSSWEMCYFPHNQYINNHRIQRFHRKPKNDDKQMINYRRPRNNLF